MKTIDERGQASLELTVALILAMLLLVGSIKVFVWINERLVLRQHDYEMTRQPAGSAPPAAVSYNVLDNAPPEALTIPGEVIVDESAYPPLNIFEKLN